MPEAVRTFLIKYKPAFFFGHVAPDVQVISGQRREETHFFELPTYRNPLDPWEKCLVSNPQFASVVGMAPEQAAFLAGYGCHLLADWLWVRDIFEPVFGLSAGWETFRERLYLHNVLRSHLDSQVLAPVRQDAWRAFEQVTLNNWLPFAQDDHLQAWRDFLAEQLKPGAKIQTVEVFASRQGIPVGDYYRLLNSENALEEAIFSHLPHSHLAAYLENLVLDSMQFLINYLSQGIPATAGWRAELSPTT